MGPSKVSIGGANFPASHGDARDDLGYGRLRPKYHVQKMLGNDVYPYRDQDEDLDHIDTGLEEDEEEEIWDRMTPPQDYDPGGGHYDPFSFAGSNTSLNGPAHIGEHVDSMVPIRQQKLYPRKSAMAVGGTKVGTARGEGSTMSATIDTGDRWGWSNPVYEEIDEDFSEEDNYTLEDIAKNQEETLRECIRLILLELL
tara:strand:- start:2038 stop:2631 length:594 start_codon:yes stop_codon:yes gene_type:complete